MFNFKSVLAALIISGTAATASADELVIDTTDLHASITADLAISMQEMKAQLNEDINTILIAQTRNDETAEERELAE